MLFKRLAAFLAPRLTVSAVLPSSLDGAAHARVAETGNIFLRLFLNAWIVMGLVLAVLSALLAPYVLYGAALVLAVAGGARFALHRGHHRLARWMFIAPVCAALVVLVPLINGIRSPILVSVPLLVVMSGWLLGRRAMWQVAGFFIAAFVLMWQAEAQGWWVMPTPFRPIEVWIMVWLFATGLAAVTTQSLIRNHEMDFQREVQLQSRLASLLDFTEAVLQQSPVPMRIFDRNGQCIKVNNAYASLVGVDRETLLAQNFQAIDMWVATGLVDDARRALQELQPIRRELPVCTSTGLGLWLEMHLLPMETGGERKLLVQVVNMTDRRRLAQELEHIAFHDPLTQLPNRRLFHDRLDHALQRHQRKGILGAVMLLDLNRFKQLNDQHGHDVGDQWLVEVAQRLRAAVRQSDTVARMGGDEFVLLLEDLGTDRAAALRHADGVAGKIRSALSLPAQLGPVSYAGSASVGLVLFADGPADPKSLVQAADAAMYADKHLEERPEPPGRGDRTAVRYA